MLTIEIETPTVERAAELFRMFGDELEPYLRAAMGNSLAEIEYRAKGNVHVVTGALRRSINALKPEPDVSPGFSGRVTVGEPYAGVEEFGINRTVNVRAHTRRGRVTRVVKSGARAGKRVRLSAKKIEASGSFSVRAHTMNMRREAHPYLRPAVAEAAQAVNNFHRLALEVAWRRLSADVEAANTSSGGRAA